MGIEVVEHQGFAIDIDHEHCVIEIALYVVDHDQAHSVVRNAGRAQ